MGYGVLLTLHLFAALIFIGNLLALFYSYESDLGNGWEDPGTYNDPPAAHEAALRMGVNLFVYAVTSRQGP